MKGRSYGTYGKREKEKTMEGNKERGKGAWVEQQDEVKR
jgi:hypothetical protein